MALPVLKVEVDWDDDNTWDHAKSDISAYVEETTIERGREGELQDIQVGTAELKLLNTSSLFSMENTGGDLFGYLKPDKKIRVTATFGGNTYNLFKGFIERYTPMPDRGQQYCYIYCVDMLYRLQQEIRTALSTNVTEHDIFDVIIPLVQKAGETISTSFDTGLDTYPYFWVEGQNALDICQHIGESSLGIFYANTAGLLVYENRNTRASKTAAATFDNVEYSMRYEYASRELVNRAVTKSYARSVGASAELWRLQETPYIAPGETRYFLAVFSNPATAITDPVALTDYAANNESGGGGASRTADMGVVVTKYAQSTLIAVTNNGSPHFYVTLLKLRGTPLTVTDSGSYAAEDSTSQASYGNRSNEFDGTYIYSIAWAENRSRYRIGKKLYPVAEIKLTLRNDAAGTITTQMLTREISDRIHVHEDQTYTDTDFYIEKIRHRIVPPGIMETEWTCTGLPQLHSWIVGTGALGDTTGLGY